MRSLLTLLTAFVLLALPATAQTDYETVADSTSLVDGGTLADVDISCMARLASGAFVFYNFPTGDLVTHNPNAAPGNRTTILRSNAQLGADLNSDVESCFAIDVDGAGNLYAALQDSSNVDQIYKLNAAGTTGTRLATADGTTGIAVTGSRVYLARVQFFGAPEDGFYRVNTTGANQTPTVVLTNPALDLVDLEVGSDGSLYSSSSEFGSSSMGLQNVVVRVANPAGTPALSVAYDPFADGIFTNGSDGGLEDVELGTGPGADRLYLYNNSFGSPVGEQWGFVRANGSNGEQFANEAAMVDDGDTDLGGYTSPSGRQMVLAGNEIFVASRDAFGGDDQIVRITGFPPVAAGPNFDLTASGVPASVAQGNSFTVTYSITNNTGNAITGDLFYTASRAGVTIAQRRVRMGTLPPGFTLNGSYVQPVPGNAPTGNYVYTVRIGQFPNTTVDSEAFALTVTAGQIAGGAATWDVTDATPWVTEGAEASATASVATVGAYPNPFARSTAIGFELGTASDVSLVVYDVRGREVATLADGTMEAGPHHVTFDASALPSGIYVYRLTTGTQVETGRVTLVR